MPQRPGVTAGVEPPNRRRIQARTLRTWIERRAHRVPILRVRSVMKKSPTPQKAAARTPNRIPTRESGHEHAPLRLGRDARLGRENAFQVERVGRSKLEARAPIRPAQTPHQLDRFTQGVLLAREPLDEASAADVSPQLPQPVHAHEIPPG